MGDKTKIDWADASWNPITGCQHGCEYCYARGIAHRYGGHLCDPWKKELHDLAEPMRKNGRIDPYPYDFEPTFHRYRLDIPARWERQRTIFVCSMADLFGDWVPDEWIQEVFAACQKAEQHRYLFLTKNPMRYIKLAEEEKLPEGENFWYGSTTTNMESMAFFHTGRKTFLSIEPILEDFTEPGNMGTIHFTDWVIIGAETGNRKGKVTPEKSWIDHIAAECER